MIKASIITVCFNSARTILDCIESVNMQTYQNIEHIFIDSASTDDTVNIINQNSKKNCFILSEEDKGIYEAMNKGVKIASGNIIGFLNSDDFYCSKNLIEVISRYFEENDLDIVYGNIDYVKANKKFIRTFYSPNNFKDVLHGFQIPHPALFIKSSYLKNLDNPFNQRFKIASDFGQQIYLAHNFNLKTLRINESFVSMRIGGLSSGLRNRIIGWLETSKIFNQITKKKGFFFLIKKVSINIFSRLKKNQNY
tara:strand:- start:189 stop:944 length:756 start_codon:yes stop_codon:yes gene_type:complete